MDINYLKDSFKKVYGTPEKGAIFLGCGLLVTKTIIVLNPSATLSISGVALMVFMLKPMYHYTHTSIYGIVKRNIANYVFSQIAYFGTKSLGFSISYFPAMIALTITEIATKLIFDYKEQRKQHYNGFDILGISRSASNNEIKVAYRRLALIYHPDKLKKQQNESEENFQARLKVQKEKMSELNLAYKALLPST